MRKEIIYNLRCNYLHNPIGLTSLSPYFTFAARQSFAYFKIICASQINRLRVNDADIWDSGLCTGMGSAGYKGELLRSGQRIYWKAIIFDSQKNIIAQSKTQFFEMGLQHDEFKADWVCQNDFNGTTAPLFRQDFVLKPKKIKQARLYITGLGYFSSFINGVETDKLYLKPLVSEYDQRELKGTCLFFNRPKRSIYYHTFDIKKLLNAERAENAIAVLAGNGWYYHKDKLVEGDYSYNSPRVLFEIHITYGDEERQVFLSGGQTAVKMSHIYKNSLFTGERVDLNHLHKADYQYPINSSFTSAEVCTRPLGKLYGLVLEADRKIKKYTGREIARRDNIVTFDFSYNHSGCVELHLTGRPGASVKIRYGEKIDKNFRVDDYNTSWGELLQIDEIKLSGDTAVYKNAFTFHGFRYAEVQLCGDIEITKFYSNFISSTPVLRGEFSCSNATINKVNRLYVQTQQSNMHGGIPSDCPHRERRGYTGDGQITCESALYSLDSEAFYYKWLKDIFDAQDERGFIPHTAPFSGGAGGPGWGSAGVIVADKLYEFTKDGRIIEKYYTGMKKWVEFLDTCHDGDYIIIRENDKIVIGDWLCPERIYLPARLVNTYFFIQCAKIVRKYSVLLGHNADTVYFDKVIARASEAFQNNFYCKKSGVYANNKNGAGFFALELGLLKGKERQEAADKIASYYITEKDKHFDTGIMATPLLLKNLHENGHKELALEILTAKGFPSFDYMIQNGATTLWECWERDISPYYTFDDTELKPGYPVSHNHPMFGSVVAYFYKYIAGMDLQSLGQGQINYNISSYNTLSYAQAKVKTLFGDAAIKWEKSDGKLKVYASTPGNVLCTVKIETQKKVFLINGEEIAGNITDGHINFSLPPGNHTIYEL